MSTTPRMIKHQRRNLARVRFEGRDFYLGKWGSEEASKNYAAFIRNLQNGAISTNDTNELLH